jgi:hypothetical protein
MAHYLAVRCHNNPDHIILLFFVKADFIGKLDPPITVAAPFLAVCLTCKEKQRFGGSEVILCWDLPSVQDLPDSETHNSEYNSGVHCPPPRTASPQTVREPPKFQPGI